MSQRAGDFGSILMGCENSYNLKKYGSAEACLDAELPNKNTIITYEEAKERAKKFSYTKNAKNLFDKLTSNPLIIGIVLVAGYFAYKKFKK